MVADRLSRHLGTTTEVVALEQVHALLDEVWTQRPDVDDSDRIAFETAVVEVVGNSVEHASPTRVVPLTVTVHVTDEALEGLVDDEGDVVPPYALDILTVADPPEPDPLAEDGRGLLLARACLDEVTVTRAGGHNLWRLVRARRA